MKVALATTEANFELPGNSLLASPPNGDIIRSIYFCETPSPPPEIKSLGVLDNTAKRLPPIVVYEPLVKLSSFSVGNIALALNKSERTSPAFLQAGSGAKPEIPQNDLVTTPSGCLNVDVAPTSSGTV